jgi:hypothetical protein
VTKYLCKNWEHRAGSSGAEVDDDLAHGGLDRRGDRATAHRGRYGIDVKYALGPRPGTPDGHCCPGSEPPVPPTMMA